MDVGDFSTYLIPFCLLLSSHVAPLVLGYPHQCGFTSQDYYMFTSSNISYEQNGLLTGGGNIGEYSGGGRESKEVCGGFVAWDFDYSLGVVTVGHES